MDIKKAIISGVSWNILNVISSRGVVILTRLLFGLILLPSEFGTYSAILVAVGLMLATVDFGLYNALIQKKFHTGFVRGLHSVFWLCFAAGIVALIFCFSLLNPLLSEMEGYTGSQFLCGLAGLTVFFYAMSVVPSALLIRRLRVGQLGKNEIIATLLSVVPAVMVYLAEPSILGLILQQLLYHLSRTILIWCNVRWRPKLIFRRLDVASLMSFGLFTAVSRLVFVLRMSLPVMVSAFIIDAGVAGIFSMAFMLTETIRQQVATIIDKIMFPIYSKNQEDIHSLKIIYLRVAASLMFVMYGIFGLGSIIAPLLINNYFDSSWNHLYECFQVLCVVGFIFAALGPSAEIMQGLGHAKKLFKIVLCVFIFCALPLTFLLTYFYGIIGASVSFLISFLLQRLITFGYVKIVLSVSWYDLVRLHVPMLPFLFLFVGFITMAPNEYNYGFVSLYVLTMMISLLLPFFSTKKLLFNV